MVKMLREKKFADDLRINELKVLNENTKRCCNSDVFSELLCSRKSLLKLLALTFIFCSVNLNYFSVAIGVTTVLKINPYLMFLLSSSFEFLGVVICHLNDFIGRRKVKFFVH